MSLENFSYSFISHKPIEKIFESLLDVRLWWFGVYDETIEGDSKVVNDEFTFLAGGGMHNTSQKLIELIPNSKITWLVTKANLTFLKKPDEWLNTKFYFELFPENNQTRITFTHEGLKPEIECYEMCSNGWMQYLKRLELKLAE